MESQRSASRFFPNPLHQDSAPASQEQTPISTQSPAQEYNPPQTSRLLGLSSRTSSTSGSVKPPDSVGNPIMAPQHHSQQLPMVQPDLGSRQSPDNQYRLRPDSSLGLGRPDVIRQRDPSPFDQVRRGQFDDNDLYVQQLESQRRASGMSNVSSEGSFGDVGFVGNGSGSAIDLIPGNPNGQNYSSGKGSRFAKFFDNKGGRDPQMVAGKPMHAGLTSPSPIQGHRPDNRVPSDTQGDPRTMEDIFAMLQNSANQVSYRPFGGTRPLLMLLWNRGIVVVVNLAKSISCTCFRNNSNNKGTLSDRTSRSNTIYPQTTAWMRCTTVVSRTKASFRMGWFPV